MVFVRATGRESFGIIDTSRLVKSYHDNEDSSAPVTTRMSQIKITERGYNQQHLTQPGSRHSPRDFTGPEPFPKQMSPNHQLKIPNIPRSGEHSRKPSKPDTLVSFNLSKTTDNKDSPFHVKSPGAVTVGTAGE